MSPPTVGLGVPIPETYVGGVPSSAPSAGSSHSRRHRQQLAPDFLVLPPDVIAVAAAYGAGLPLDPIPGAGGRPQQRAFAGSGGGDATTRPHPTSQMDQDAMLAAMLQSGCTRRMTGPPP